MAATDELTYDPVVASQPLPRVRLLSPLRPPPPGRALVLVPERGPALTIRPGDAVSDARHGVYQGMFLVDTTEHLLVFAPFRLASRDEAAPFHCRVEVLCQVTDPAEVVSRGIRDMSRAWHGPILDRLLAVARSYGVRQFDAADEALNAALSGLTGDAAVRLYGARLELLAAAPRRSRVRGARPAPGEPAVLRGEVVDRRDEPTPPPAPPPPPTPPPPPGPRPSRVRGTAKPRREGGARP